jgi:hypothetical protein
LADDIRPGQSSPRGSNTSAAECPSQTGFGLETHVQGDNVHRETLAANDSGGDPVIIAIQPVEHGAPKQLHAGSPQCPQHDHAVAEQVRRRPCHACEVAPERGAASSTATRVTPAADRAAAIVSPSSDSMRRSSNRNDIARPTGRMEGWVRRIGRSS